ncbi:unnamed protein product [Staurois parvus]|uniref:Uncharacterized protein n=1 Tax=Staurois parvus TaxID=386267 RepID=A0ABN9BQT0_9NEOB|nr:unnamed protein product [Staurois parvus]
MYTRKCRLSAFLSSRAGTDDQCALMISVAPEVPPVSAHQCHVPVPISATCQCLSVPHQCHISVHTSAHQCHISVPI